MIKLSIVIVNWNTRELLSRCLASIKETVAGLPYETLVVDNASTDDSTNMVRDCFPWVHRIENSSNVGFAAANNQAIRQSQGQYVLLLNSDTLVQTESIRALVAFMEAHPRIGAAGPRLLNADGSLQPSCQPMLTPGRELWRLLFLDNIWRRASYPMNRWNVTTPHRVQVIKGACLMLRRDALDQVGLLDEGYFMYTEEVDLCYRLRQCAWELWWVPWACVIHYGGQSSLQAAEEMYLQLYRSKIQFYRKYLGEAQVAKFKKYVRLAYWPRSVFASLAAILFPSLSRRVLTFRNLLTELRTM